MNDIQEAHFVAREMLPKGRYEGRLSVGVARHLSRCLAGTSLPSSLKMDVSVESTIALSLFLQSLSKQSSLDELYWHSALPLECLHILADCFMPFQLSVLHVRVERPWEETPSETISDAFRRLSRIPTSTLRISLSPGWHTIQPLLQGLHAERLENGRHPRVSLSIHYNNEFMWCTAAHHIRSFEIIESLEVIGGVWGPASWSGLISCLLTSSLDSLTLSQARLADKTPSSALIQSLRQALLDTKLGEMNLVNVDGSGQGGSLSMVEVLLASMTCHRQVDPTDPLEVTVSHCKLKSLTLKAKPSNAFGGSSDYALAIYTSLARRLPHMQTVRRLRTGLYPATFSFLWQAVCENESLLCADLGTSTSPLLELLLERNRLIQSTRNFCCGKRTMGEALEYASNHGLLDAPPSSCEGSITASAAYWLVRACLPPNIQECQESEQLGYMQERKSTTDMMED